MAARAGVASNGVAGATSAEGLVKRLKVESDRNTWFYF
jgi:hypothetical protein